MTKSLDLKILPIYHQGGQQAEIPGLQVSSPPRGSARRRSEEQLILHLSMAGNAPLSPTNFKQILNKLAQVFYEAEGSTTSALRAVAEVLNQYLHDRNLKGSSRGIRGVGLLTQVVLRSNKVILAQSGGSHVFFVNPGDVKELHDTDLAGPGLGAGRVPKVRYYQETLSTDDIMLVTPRMPAAWSDTTLKNLSRMSLKSIYHRLTFRVEDDLNAILFFPEEGSGDVKVLKPVFGEKEISPQPEQHPERKITDESPPWDPSIPEPDHTPPRETESLQEKVTQQSLSEDQPAQMPEGEHIEPADDLAAVQEQQSPSTNLLKKILDSPVWSFLGTLSRSVGSGIQALWNNLVTLLGRMLPDERYLDFPGWVLGLIAVIIPLLIVAFGSVMYIRRGRNTLYESSYGEAQQLFQTAQELDSSEEHYQLLSQAFEKLELARGFRETEEVISLYSEVRSELDEMDRITRLNYQPLFSHGLGADVEISEIVVTAWNDLYMLNERDGTVIWAQSNAEGYEIKDDFHCGPITGHKTVGPLVDIVPLSAKQEDEATILGIDRSHTMIFCYPDADEPPVMFEDTSYTLERGPVEAMTISANSPENLYILDPEKRAIWIEFQSQNYHEGSEYFGATDSPTMEDAVDLATNGSELYILHADGYITRCVTESPTADPQCVTPFEFSDPRAGRTSGPFMAGAQFKSLKFKGSPGMAIYMLDPTHQSLYRFSTQLEYQRQFRPADDDISGEVTAFTVTMSDRIYLAAGNQVFTAQLIP